MKPAGTFSSDFAFPKSCLRDSSLEIERARVNEMSSHSQLTEVSRVSFFFASFFVYCSMYSYSFTNTVWSPRVRHTLANFVRGADVRWSALVKHSAPRDADTCCLRACRGRLDRRGLYQVLRDQFLGANHGTILGLGSVLRSR